MILLQRILKKKASTYAIIVQFNEHELRFVKIVGKNLYRNKLKLTTIFDKPVTRTPCALLPVLQKIHLTIVNLSRKEKNAKISFENYEASKIMEEKKGRKEYIENEITKETDR